MHGQIIAFQETWEQGFGICLLSVGPAFLPGGFCYSFYTRSNQQLDAMLHKSAGLSPETEMEPHALSRLGGVVCDCRTNADRVPAAARSANRQRGGRSSVRFYGVVMATARAGARAASPRGLRAKGGTPPCARGCGGRWGTGGGAEREEPVGSVGGCGLGAAGSGQPRGGDSPVPAEERGPVAAGRGCYENCELQGLAFPGDPSAAARGKGGTARWRGRGAGQLAGGVWRGRRSPGPACPGSA